MTELIWAKSEDERERCFAIRRRVFLDEQKIAPEAELDGSDADAELLLLVCDGEDAATGRVVPDGRGGLTIGRIATLKGFRRRGLGSILVNELVRRVFERGEKSCHIHAQLHAEHFYRGLGFVPCGEVFNEENIPHISMVREAGE